MKQLTLTPALHQYMLDVSLREHPVLKKLREVTAPLPLAGMQISPEQGQFLQFMVQLINAKRILEIGTFTGYSALAMALALPEEGQLVTCDINPEWTKIGLPYWQEAQQHHKIDLRIAPALNTLNELINTHQAATFDFIFIDADKANYVQYYELALQLVKPNGLIAIDNIFWDGQVIDTNDTSSQTKGIRKLNALLKKDKRVYISLLPLADGLFLVQPKGDQ